MAQISLRSDKGRPLTIAEVDNNFDSINKEVGLKLDASAFNPTNILAQIAQADGEDSGLDADKLQTYYPSKDALDNTVAVRNHNGDLFANRFRGDFVGNVTGNITGNVTGDVSGNATNVDGTVAVAHGGTSATTAEDARANLGCGSMAIQNKGTVDITGGTITGITDLAVADGGTGAGTPEGARTNLGLVIGQQVQAYSSTLSSIAAFGTTTFGFVVKNAAGGATTRSIAIGNSLEITNADGVSGNPTIALVASPAVTSIQKSGSNGVGDIGQTANRFNIIYGRSTSASYADLAEKYTTDQEYECGTVIVVSHDDSGAEATQSFASNQRVLGVVSTNPAHVMNDESTGQAIGLVGRLPVKIVGPIRKGQPVISTPDGKGTFGDTSNSFGIALETNLDAGVKLVECVVK
jgi:hypothetical protein